MMTPDVGEGSRVFCWDLDVHNSDTIRSGISWKRSEEEGEPVTHAHGRPTPRFLRIWNGALTKCAVMATRPFAPGSDLRSKRHLCWSKGDGGVPQASIDTELA